MLQSMQFEVTPKTKISSKGIQCQEPLGKIPALQKVAKEYIFSTLQCKYSSIKKIEKKTR